MPHSSGGGSSGGGFHSSSGGSHSSHSGSSSRPTVRTGSHYFPGAHCYIYYDARRRAHALYSNGEIATTRINYGNFIVLGAMLLVPIAILGFIGIHRPQKIRTDYATSITVTDQLNVLSDAEENTLKNTFQEFFTISGICPSFVTISNQTWKDANYASLEGYAFDYYVDTYADESHWLIVYAADDASKKNWAFEGMQGDDTDDVLTVRVANNFNKTAASYLEAGADVGASFENAFRTIMPTLMDVTFHLDPAIWVFCVIWEGIAGTVFAMSIIDAKRRKAASKATRVEVPEGKDLRKVTCAYCGGQYYEGTIIQCPHCGATVNDDFYDPKDLEK